MNNRRGIYRSLSKQSKNQLLCVQAERHNTTKLHPYDTSAAAAKWQIIACPVHKAIKVISGTSASLTNSYLPIAGQWIVMITLSDGQGKKLN